jgi:sigma-B regulation protein RsbU (phosphoserine phosphatase)
LEPTGTPVGLLEETQFTSQALQLDIGDVLVMFTDGITEAENPAHELWGQKRLETLLRACRDCTPAQIIGRILDEVLAFSESGSQSDDMTLVVVGVKDEAEFDRRRSCAANGSMVSCRSFHMGEWNR